jgi:hypothetical protein
VVSGDGVNCSGNSITEFWCLSIKLRIPWRLWLRHGDGDSNNNSDSDSDGDGQ